MYPGIKVNISKLKGGSQPPKNNKVVIELIKTIIAYTPKKNKEIGKEE